MDNKIAFEEYEYPALTADDIEFDTESDREQFTNKQKTTGKKDNGNALPQRKRAKNAVASQKEPVLTRSKARKAAARKQKESTESTEIASLDLLQTTELGARETTVQQSTNSIAISSHGVSTRSTKRRIHESHGDERNNIEPIQPNAKRVSTMNLESLNTETEGVNEFLSSSAELNRLHEKFKDILKSNVSLGNTTNCIMACNRKKATVLLPCRHQPICNQCYVLWRLFTTQALKKVVCPLCRNTVTQNIVVCDD